MDKVLEKYEPVVGVEIHVQLATASKAYCSCSTVYSPLQPNTNICPVCMGEPGSLPVPNQHVVEIAAKAGMALGCTIAQVSQRLLYMLCACYDVSSMLSSFVVIYTRCCAVQVSACSCVLCSNTALSRMCKAHCNKLCLHV
jgi:GatB/GatE catalytic domain